MLGTGRRLRKWSRSHTTRCIVFRKICPLTFMTNSLNAERQARRRKMEELLMECPLRFPPVAWRVSSTASASAARRATLLARLRDVGREAAKCLAAVMTETLVPVGAVLKGQSGASGTIAAKTLSLDEWPSVVQGAPWTKGAKLTIYIDRKDEAGAHLIADLIPGDSAEKASPSVPAIGVAVHSPDGEEAVAEVRPNFTTRVFSRPLSAALDDLAVTIVALTS
jgi:hypothetical protein